MRLDKYFSLPDAKTQTQVAKEIGKARSYVSRVKIGSLTPSLIVASRISQATGGLVSLEDLIPEDKKVEPKEFTDLFEQI